MSIFTQERYKQLGRQKTSSVHVTAEKIKTRKQALMFIDGPYKASEVEDGKEKRRRRTRRTRRARGVEEALVEIPFYANNVPLECRIQDGVKVKYMVREMLL